MSNPVPPPPAQNQPGSPSTEGAAPEDPTVPLVSGEGAGASGSPAAGEADSEPTRLLSAGSSDDSEPTQPMSAGSSDDSEPTEPLSDGSEPTELLSYGSEPTELLSDGSEPTAALSDGSEPSPLMAAGSEPTELMAAGSEPTQFMTSGSGPAGFESAESERTELLSSRPVPLAQPAAVGAEPAGQFGEQPPRPTRSARNLLLSVVGIVVVVIIGAAIMLAAGGGRDKDEAKDAKVGDCVAALGKVSQKEGENTQTAAKVVKCGAQNAAYKVIGRVNGQSDTNSKACDRYFTDAKADYFIYASGSGDGYLLCLRSTKA